MKITVYGAASSLIDKSYIEKGEELGRKMAEHGHGLVFGGGANGMMGAVAKGIYEGTKNDFATFMGALINLPKSKWFLKVVEEWYFWFEGDGPEYKEDALESHYRIKAIADEYRKSQGIKLRS